MQLHTQARLKKKTPLTGLGVLPARAREHGSAACVCTLSRSS
jgi:hypothetical protein